MEISSNVNSQLVNVGSTSVNQAGQMQGVNLLKVVDATSKQVQIAIENLQGADSAANPPDGSWGMAKAAVKAIMGMVRGVPTLWRVPLPIASSTVIPVDTRPPNQMAAVSIGQQGQATVAPASGTQTESVSSPPVQHSLLPHWAEIFKFTGNSEWRPGGASENSYIWLRKELKGDVEKVQILSPDQTKVIATGSFSKVGDDGRTRFNFNKKSGEIPSGAIVMVTLKNNGGIRYIEIDKPNRAFKW
jgi:hypothetical protein